MESNIRIRSFEPKDKADVFRLLASFYDNMRSEGDWDHLYNDNPDGKAVISLAEVASENRVVGHYSAIKMPVVIFKKVYLGSKGEGEIFDFSVIKHMLDKGKVFDRSLPANLLKHTVDGAVKENIAFVCTNPSDLALKSHIDAGFKPLKQDFDIFVFIFNKNYLRHLLSGKLRIAVINNIISSFLSGIFKFFYILNMFRFKNKDISLEPFDHFNDSTDRLMDEFAGICNCITIERKQAHLNWRFGAADYRKFIIKSEGKPVGYIVIHIFVNPNGFKEASLVDYLFLPLFWNDFSSVVTKILKTAKEAGCDLLRINYMYDFKERVGLAGVLKKMFFIKRPDRRNIVLFLSPQVYPLENEMLDVNNWFFTDLYFENY